MIVDKLHAQSMLMPTSQPRKQGAHGHAETVIGAAAAYDWPPTAAAAQLDGIQAQPSCLPCIETKCK
jgi:hypothetical protein